MAGVKNTSVLQTDGPVMFIKLIMDKVSYPDETPEYILPFIKGTPIFEAEVCVIKPGKLSTEICIV